MNFFARLLLLAPLLALFLPASHAEQSNALQTIKQSGVIRMGYLGAAPPFSFEDNGKPAGYTVELCTKVAEDIGKQLGKPLRIEWVKLTQQNRLEAVREGRVQVECGTTTWTLSRQEQVDFSLMTFIDGATVLVRGGGDVVHLADLAGKRIGVVHGTTTERTLQQALKQRNVNAEVVPVDAPAKGVEMVGAGKLDGYASDRLVLLGLGLSAQTSTGFRLLDEDFSVEPYALALPRGDYDLRLAVNRALARIYRTGAIDAVFEHWLGELGKPSMLLAALYYLQSIPE